MQRSTRSALSPQTWPFSLEWLPDTAYLVGGAVRDALLERTSDYLDLDFVVSENAVETARQLAQHYKAGFVLLDADRQIARVVFKQGTVDFAQQEGDTVEADLHRRDFTVNAIAYHPHTAKLIDPLHGYGDLQQGWLRMVSAENLKDDPLRLLRAYRQAAQLGFDLEPQTRDEIRKLAPQLTNVAAERVNSELNYLLRTEKGTPWIIRGWENGLLAGWLPSTTHADVVRIAKIDQAVHQLAENWSLLAAQLLSPMHHTLKTSWVALAKLASLVASGDTERELACLKYSRREMQAAASLLKAWHQVNSADAFGHRSIADQLFWFKGLGEVFVAWTVFAVAAGLPMEAIAPSIDRYLNPDDPVAHPRPIIDGNTLMDALNLSKGPQIGRLLTAIQIARAEGHVRTPEEAISLARFVYREQAMDRDALVWETKLN
jgi:tRNA nucleotidyltransferase (CCA-adding enzyme)